MRAWKCTRFTSACPPVAQMTKSSPDLLCIHGVLLEYWFAPFSKEWSPCLLRERRLYPLNLRAITSGLRDCHFGVWLQRGEAFSLWLSHLSAGVCDSSLYYQNSLTLDTFWYQWQKQIRYKKIIMLVEGANLNWSWLCLGYLWVSPICSLGYE